MKAFILAAGYGDRLSPITEHIPKPLVPVLNVPALVYAVNLVKEAGIREAVINVHYLPGSIISFLKSHDNFGLDLSFSIEEEILGTGGGLMRCRDLLDDDDVLLVNSDVICDVFAEDLVQSYRNSGADGLVLLARVPSGEATVSVEGERVKDFRGVLGSGIVPLYDYSGIAVLSPAVFDHLSEEFSSVVYTGFTGLVSERGLACAVHGGIWRDIGTPANLLETNLSLLRPDARDFLRRVEHHTGLRPVPVSDRAHVAVGASVEDSVIGEGVRVAPGARIRGSLVLSGELGETADVDHCLLYEGRRLA